jgi:hypothetical protein
METPKYTMDNLLWKVTRFMMMSDDELENYSLPNRKELSKAYPQLIRELTKRTPEMRLENEFNVDILVYTRMIDGLLHANPALTNSFIASFMCDYADVSADAYEESVLLCEARRREYYQRHSNLVGHSKYAE